MDRFRIGTVNVGTLGGTDLVKAGEVVETLTRRGIDLCCVQESRWNGRSCRLVTGKDSVYKFFWVGGGRSIGGVAICLAEKWVKDVSAVSEVSDRILVMNLLIGQTMTTVISVYAPQRNCTTEEKDSFYSKLLATVAKQDKENLVIIAGDLNGHVGKCSEGYEGIHGGRGYGTRNTEGERILEFGSATNMVVANTMFDKRDSRLITYVSGEDSTQIDYILIDKNSLKLVKDVKVIAGEEIALQHRLVIGDLRLTRRSETKAIFVPRRKTWKLNNMLTRGHFRTQLGKLAAEHKVGVNIHEKWTRLKDCHLKATDLTCGWTKRPTKCHVTWWWNNTVDKAIKIKRACFRKYKTIEANHSKNYRCKDKDKAKDLYKVAKRKADATANTAQTQAISSKLPSNTATYASTEVKLEIYKVAKQTVKTNQDVVGEQCVRDDMGTLAYTEDAKKKAWSSHYNHLLNIEFDWDQDSLSQADPIERPITIEKSMVVEAINKMKKGKAPGPSDVSADMIKAGGDLSTEMVHDLISDVIKEAEIPVDWQESIIINLFKGKGDATVPGNYRGLKLTDHVLKILERVVEKLIRKNLEIDAMQFGFMPGRSTTDAIFILRQLQEKAFIADTTLYFAFVDLEKAFDRVPRKVVWWAMRKMGVSETLVKTVQAMYHNARAKVRVGTSLSEEFEVKVGVHQGSVLSPLLFIIVLEALSVEFRTGCPWELLYADDLALVAKSMEELTVQLQNWKQAMEAKGLRVNMGKTKVMVSGKGLGPATKKEGKYPCSICHKGTRNGAIACTSCRQWVHLAAKCSGVQVKSLAKEQVSAYVCRACTGEHVEQAVQRPESLVLEGDTLDMVDKFCYLGDTLGAGGGARDCSVTRVGCAWKKFRELLPVLTSRRFSLRIRGQAYRACVRSVLLYGCETWAVKEEDTQRIERNDRAMIRWICGVSLKDKRSSEELLKLLGIECIKQKMRNDRLRWLGHVERKGEDDWVRKCRGIEMGPTKQGGQIMNWDRVLRADRKAKGIDEKWVEELVQSQEGWREACKRGNRAGVWEVLESVRKKATGATDTAASARDPGTSRRLTRSSSAHQSTLES